MLIGAGIVLYPNVSQFRLGDFLILGAAMIAPLGNFFQRKARSMVSSESILFVRSLSAVPVAFLLAYLFGENLLSVHISSSLLILLVINGIFLFGLSKILWIEGIHRISIVKASALASIAPFFTLLFAGIILNEMPTVWQLLALIPISVGLVLLGARQRKTPER